MGVGGCGGRGEISLILSPSSAFIGRGEGFSLFIVVFITIRTGWMLFTQLIFVCYGAGSFTSRQCFHCSEIAPVSHRIVTGMSLECHWH